MKKQAGFTLIELVIVIIILGILAVTAAPKFLNLQDDAKKAAADGVKGAVASSAQLVYSRAVLDGNEKDTTGTKTVTLADNTTVTIKYGYPTATSAGIGKAATIDPCGLVVLVDLVLPTCIRLQVLPALWSTPKRTPVAQHLPSSLVANRFHERGAKAPLFLSRVSRCKRALP